MEEAAYTSTWAVLHCENMSFPPASHIIVMLRLRFGKDMRIIIKCEVFLGCNTHFVMT